MPTSPELRLLLTCCRARADRGQLRAAMTAHVSWTAFADRAVALGLAPLAHARLRDSDLADGVPEPMRGRLAAEYLAQAARNARAHAHMERAIATLQRAGIQVAVLKGAALAEPVYGDLAVRSMVDVDLMVGAADLLEADRLLRADGFTPYEDWRSAAWYVEHGHHHVAPLIAPDRSVMIEVHQYLMSPETPVAFPTDGLWRRMRPVRVGESEVLTLEPTDLLLHVAAHLTSSGSVAAHLRTLVDIGLLCALEPDGVDWDAAVARARAAQGSRHVWYPLEWARRMVAAAVPDEALARLLKDAGRSGMAHRLFTRAGTRLLTEPSETPWHLPGWFWEDLLARWVRAPRRTGVGATVAAVYRALMRGARERAPGWGPLLPVYALTVGPIGALARALRRRIRT